MATPITNAQGGLIAMSLAIACLLLRAWLTSPRRRFPRLIFAPPPRIVRSEADREGEAIDDGQLSPEAFGEGGGGGVGAGPGAPAVDASSPWRGRN